MKIVSHYLQSIDGVTIYPIISLLIFLTMFSLLTIWALRIRKEDIQKMSMMPFDENEGINQDINLIK